MVADLIDQFFEVVSIRELHVFLPKIQFKFHQTGEMDEFFAKFLDLVFEPTPQLPNRHIVRRSTFRRNEVGHRFGLGEIHFSVEKSTEGKLARVGQTRTPLQT